MKKIALTFALSLTLVVVGFAQKGPAYKNAKASEKYDGNSSVLLQEDPRQFVGPAYKNLDRSQYKIEVLDPRDKIMPSTDNMIVSTKDTMYQSLQDTERIIYRRIETKDMEGLNTKKLKGPAYKNYRPGN